MGSPVWQIIADTDMGGKCGIETTAPFLLRADLETLRGSVSRAVAHKAERRLSKGCGPDRRPWEIRPRLTGLVRNAPAEGRQARPDLARVKSGKGKGANYTTCATSSLQPQTFLPSLLPLKLP